MKIPKIILCGAIGLILLQGISLANTEIIKTGVASPQTKADEGNIEKLRNRAIRNAMDLAVMQVTGTEVSSQRGTSLHTQDVTAFHDGKTVEQTQTKSRYNSKAISRTKGYARLLEILKEWQENGQYYVKARIAVFPPEEHETMKNCGYYWLQAGKPPISISFLEEHDGIRVDDDQARTLKYFRDNLNRNGLHVSTNSNNNQYQIRISQALESRQLPEYGITTVNCRLSFQLIDISRQNSVAEFVANNGPQAGVSLEHAQIECIKVIAPGVSEKLIRSIGSIMADRWNNGIEQKIVIDGIPGNIVSNVSGLLQNIYRITYTTPAKYAHGQYSQTVKFKGSGSDLTRSIHTVFLEEGWKISVTQVSDSEIHFQWMDIQQ